MEPRRARGLCAVAGLALVVVAGVHVVKAARGEGDVTRHLVFVLLDGGLGALVALRPRWALAPVVILFAQQLTTHGVDLARSIRGTVPLDVESLLVLAFFGALLALLVAVRRGAKTAG